MILLLIPLVLGLLMYFTPPDQKREALATHLKNAEEAQRKYLLAKAEGDFDAAATYRKEFFQHTDKFEEVWK